MYSRQRNDGNHRGMAMPVQLFHDLLVALDTVKEVAMPMSSVTHRCCHKACNPSSWVCQILLMNLAMVSRVPLAFVATAWNFDLATHCQIVTCNRSTSQYRQAALMSSYLVKDELSQLPAITSLYHLHYTCHCHSKMALNCQTSRRVCKCRMSLKWTVPVRWSKRVDSLNHLTTVLTRATSQQTKFQVMISTMQQQRVVLCVVPNLNMHVLLQL